VVLDGADAEEETLADLLVGQTLAYELENLILARSQVRDPAWLRLCSTSQLCNHLLRQIG